jgi:hypothetical protein
MDAASLAEMIARSDLGREGSGTFFGGLREARVIETQPRAVLASRLSGPHPLPADEGQQGSSRATAGGGFVMLIPEQSTKSAVFTFPTRNACLPLLHGVNLPLQRRFPCAANFRISIFEFCITGGTT